MIQDMQQLSLEQKIGQLFFIGISGTENDDETSTLLREVNPGGICLFSRNIREPEQTPLVARFCPALLPVEPILSLDQEGGLVDRLRRILGPSPAASKIRTEDDAFLFGQLTAEAIRILGLNADFAPVVDVVNDRRSAFSNGLHSRAYGHSVSEVIKLAGSFMRALSVGGCLACFKHFPGLGASEIDSHEDLPAVNIVQEEFDAVDLRPYRELLSADTGLRRDGRSRRLSDYLTCRKLTKMANFYRLRLVIICYNSASRRLGFDGLVMTDDLEMGAIVKNYGIGDACKMAIRAGADMLAICAGRAAIYEGFNAVVAAVNSGDIIRIAWIIR